MKKILLLTTVLLFLVGCGANATKSDFWKHDTMYKNWDHMRFSLWGYKNPTAEDYRKSVEEGWWGVEVPNVPKK